MYISFFWWFQGVLFVRMIRSYHVKICRTHPQIFKHYCINFVTIVKKCIFGVTLVVSCHRVVALREVCCSCVLDELCYCVFKCSKYVIIVKILSLFLSLSKFMKALRLSNLASCELLELCIAQYQPSSCDPSSWHYAMHIYYLPGLCITQFQCSSLNLGLQNYTIHPSILASTTHCNQ